MNKLRPLSRFAGVTVRTSLICGLVLAVVGSLLRAEISEADKKKRDAFLKAREEMHTIGTPEPADSPRAKPKAAKRKGRKKATKPSPAPATKQKEKKNSEEDEEEPRPHPTPVPRASVVEQQSSPSRAAPNVPPPVSTAPFNAPADITIQKSGLEEEQGYEPPPPPPPRKSFWSRVFGGGETRGNYRYLSSSVIDAIRRAPVQRSRWKFIIVHNSGTRQGNARAFDFYHRRVRRMQNGLAYHFVVGNGTSSGNGQIEIGDRWRRQINGGHVHSDYLNNISLGICLVGDFNREQPTRAQLEATEELIKYLRERCGRAEGRAIPVRPHREMNPPQWSTDCPGDAFPYGWFRRF